MEQKRPRRPTHATDEELAAITREIHAQLRALYEGEGQVPAAARPRRRAVSPRSAADMARFLGAFLVPTLFTFGLVVLLRYLGG